MITSYAILSGAISVKYPTCDLISCFRKYMSFDSDKAVNCRLCLAKKPKLESHGSELSLRWTVNGTFRTSVSSPSFKGVRLLESLVTVK